MQPEWIVVRPVDDGWMVEAGHLTAVFSGSDGKVAARALARLLQEECWDLQQITIRLDADDVPFT